MNTGGGRPFSGRGSSLLFPFLMEAALFFIWGLCQAMLDVLNKHIQSILHVSKTPSGCESAESR